MKKTLLILGISLFISSLLIISCKEEDRGDDLIEGKWINADIQDNSSVSDCEKKSYLEFAPYKLEQKNRTVSFHNYCDESIKDMGTYTIKEDSLYIKDISNNLNIYKIEYINETEMFYYNVLESYRFKRID